MIKVTIEIESSDGEIRIVTEDPFESDSTPSTNTLNLLVRRAHEQADKALLAKRNPQWVV